MFKHSFGTVLVGLLQYWNLEKKIHHNSEDMLDLDLKKDKPETVKYTCFKTSKGGSKQEMFGL